MMSLSTTTCLLLMLASQAPKTAAPQGAEPLEVKHVPVAQVSAGQPLVLKAEVAPAWRLDKLIARYHAAGETDWHEVAFERSADGSHAAILPLPPEQRVPLEYYLVARDTSGEESVRFAGREAPHPVLINVTQQTLEREAMLEVYGHRRSRVSSFAEYVDYGSRTGNGGRYPDSYYRLETEYLYRLFTPVSGFRLDAIRIGVGHLRARTASWNDRMEPTGVLDMGLDYGFSELEVGINPHFGLAGRLVLGGNTIGFTAGFGGRLRIGRPTGSRVELEGEYNAGLGAAATIRLAWDTVPRFPMSAAAQVTNIPLGPPGVRLLYRADYALTDAVLLGVQLGYQARTSVGGGPSLGFAASYGW
jgi:hypothetical protein